MSTEHVVETVLYAEFSQINIEKVLRRAITHGLICYDHIAGKHYGSSPIISAEEAAVKVIKAYNDKSEFGPCVYATYCNDNFFIWFYKNDEGFLRFDIGGIGAPKRKDHMFDFAHYIYLALKWSEDFPIYSLKTDVF